VRERKVEAGEIVYREGDPGDALFIIEEGDVEVLRTVGGTRVRLAVLRKGASFGETGVIRSKPRSTTTRAVGPVSLIEIPRETFLATFRDDNPLALSLLQMLCERLLAADSQLIEQRLYSDGARLDSVGRIRLLPASPETEGQIGSEGRAIEALPFRVGRQGARGEQANAIKPSLVLQMSDDQMSPLHFAVEGRDGRLSLRDLDSHLGTMVNGVRVAHFEYANTADLRFGENLVQAGGAESPYRFRIIVERNDAP
jgi:CRP-like cAMP-binding protein